MAVDECSGSVVFTEQAAIDVVEPVPRNKPVPAGGTCETLEMVHVALCPHDQLARRNGLTTSTACSTIAKQPDVVVSTEDHAAFGVAGRADLAQLCLAARALEASAVPVAVHGVKEEAVCDFAPAACTPLPGQRPCSYWWWLGAASGIHHRPSFVPFKSND